MTELSLIYQGRDVLLLNTLACNALHIAPVPEWLHQSYWQTPANRLASGGRGETIMITEPAQMVLRTYKRGGLIRHLAERRFLYSGIKSSRVFKELTLLNQMHRAGLPVPLGLAGRVSRFGLAYEASILMTQIPHSMEVHDYINTKPLSKQLWTRIGSCIRQMHNAQVYHHDLNIHNILIDNEEQIWLIDFDKCRIQHGQQWKSDNLARLKRSLNKEKNRSSVNYFFDAENWQMLVNGYQTPIASSDKAG